jgi:hypothetical protein
MVGTFNICFLPRRDTMVINDAWCSPSVFGLWRVEGGLSGVCNGAMHQWGDVAHQSGPGWALQWLPHGAGAGLPSPSSARVTQRRPSTGCAPAPRDPTVGALKWRSTPWSNSALQSISFLISTLLHMCAARTIVCVFLLHVTLLPCIFFHRTWDFEEGEY